MVQLLTYYNAVHAQHCSLANSKLSNMATCSVASADVADSVRSMPEYARIVGTRHTGQYGSADFDRHAACLDVCCMACAVQVNTDHQQLAGSNMAGLRTRL